MSSLRHGLPPAAVCVLLLATLAPAAPVPDREGLPPGALARLGTLHFRHADLVNAVAFSPDGRTILTGDSDGTALVWEATAVPRGGLVPGAEPTPAELKALWADLAGDDAGRAYRAMGRLAAAPKAAVPFLQERLRAKAEPVPAARAVEVLEQIGTDEARRVLAEVAKGDANAPATAEAQAALRRLGK